MKINQKLRKAFFIVESFKVESIRAALAQHGLTDQEIQRGRELVVEASQKMATLSPRVRRTSVQRKILAWDRRWTLIVAAALRFDHEEAHARIFAGLQRGTGPQMVLFVNLLVTRLHVLFTSEDPSDRSAWAAVENHGLAPAALEDMRRVLAEAATFSTDGIPIDAENPTEKEAAVERAYRFYLKWSLIARAVITSRTVRRTMGIGARQRNGEEELEADDVSSEASTSPGGSPGPAGAAQAGETPPATQPFPKPA